MPERDIPERNHHEFAEFERQLTQLAPHASRVDRETLLFRAGQESMLARSQPSSRAAWLWPLTAAAMTILSAGLSWQLYARGGPGTAERVRIVERAEATLETSVPRDPEPTVELLPVHPDTAYVRNAPALPRDHYIRRRELALTVGMDAVTVPVAFRATEAAGASSYRELRSTYTEPSSRGGEKGSQDESMNNNRFPGEQS